MPIHALAGKPAPQELLIDPAALERAYYEGKPDAGDPRQKVAFGTSGHRGTSGANSFNEAHILAITQAICEYRRLQGIAGPLYMGKDSHALSAAAQRTALEVLAANGVHTCVQENDGYTPTPVISRAILTHNRAAAEGGAADGIVITPSHNPPQDGGFKYNPPNGGPADTDVTKWIENRANALLQGGNASVLRMSYESALKAPNTRLIDFVKPFVDDLASVIDMEAIAKAGIRIGVDPLGGASVGYWGLVAETYGLQLSVVNSAVDPTFGFMTVDHDGKIRMDCSSPYAMASLVRLKDDFDVSFGNDPDADRHGIVTRSSGLLNPNHYLAVAIRYLLQHREGWPADSAVGKTLVSSGAIDRVVSGLNRRVYEVPVGFKWFVDGLFSGSLCFGGEESAGASFLRRDGTVWTTDKDGLILGLLAAEILAVTGKDPGQHYNEIEAAVGRSYYTRVDTPVEPEAKAAFAGLTPSSVKASELAGEPITARLTNAPGNGAPLGGLKLTTENGWFAARPSGTENIYKIYAESFRDQEHLNRILEEAREIVGAALAAR